MVNYTTNMAAGVEKFETYQGKTLNIPSFNDGMLIQRTPNFAVVYGYKKGLHGQEKGQRTFVVATNAIASEILKAAATKHDNVMDTVDIPDQKMANPGLVFLQLDTGALRHTY